MFWVGWQNNFGSKVATKCLGCGGKMFWGEMVNNV